MISPSRRMLLHLTDPRGREFAVVDDPLALEDLTESRRLGNILGDLDLHPFVITLDGTLHLIVAGLAGRHMHHVDVAFPHGQQLCRVCYAVWATFPEPFTPDKPIHAVWRDEAGVELRRLRACQ